MNINQQLLNRLNQPSAEETENQLAQAIQGAGPGNDLEKIWGMLMMAAPRAWGSGSKNPYPEALRGLGGGGQPQQAPPPMAQITRQPNTSGNRRMSPQELQALMRQKMMGG